MEVNTKKLGEIYKEWRGNESCYDNGKPVFEADELLDFAQFLLKHEANVVDKRTESCHIQNVNVRFPSKEQVIKEGERQTNVWLEGNTERELQHFRVGFRRSFEYVLRCLNAIDKETEVKRLLNEFDSKHSVSISDTEKNINDIAERIVKLFAIPDVVCSCCGKNTPEICGSCVSDIAQSTGDAVYNSR